MGSKAPQPPPPPKDEKPRPGPPPPPPKKETSSRTRLSSLFLPPAVNVLVSLSGTREQVAEALARLAGAVLFSDRCRWEHTTYGTGELDVYSDEHARIRNVAVLRAAESGLLDAVDPDRPACEEAMRGEGQTEGGL